MTPLGLLSAGNGTEVLLFEKIIKSGKERGSSPHSPGHRRDGCETLAMLWDHTANLALVCQSCLGYIPLSFSIPKARRLKAQNSLNHCKMTLSQSAQVLLAVLQGSHFA